MRQQGSAFTGVIGLISGVAIALGSDHTGLGRWDWIQLKGQDSSTYVITTCQCIESRSTVGTVFIQREQHLKKCGFSTCLKMNFIQDLVQFITGILGQKNKVIAAADANEHVIDRVLLRALKNYGLIEACVKKFDLPSPISHITRSLPIDSV